MFRRAGRGSWAAACVVAGLAAGTEGCATIKQSDTSRTGIEQLLISSAADKALDKVDFAPMRGAKVYVEAKYLECVDKNYILVSLRQRLMQEKCQLVEKLEEADVVVEVGSGGVGTDRQEMFIGVPDIPLPPPSPISIPRIPFMTRSKAMGTAKLIVLAYDAKTKASVIDGGNLLARSDYKNWSVLGAGPMVSGSVPEELTQQTGESETVLPPTPSFTASRGGKRTF